VAIGYAFVGAGVGFAGTPASHSLTGSVPVNRAGMASGTADLQRDLGGAIMQSILGALFTAGYATAFNAAIVAEPSSTQQQITSAIRATLTKSFAGAESVVRQYPQYASEITSAARQSFLEGSNWAYIAGITAIVFGAALVYFLFPRQDDERRLLTQYCVLDTRKTAESGRR
jgi:DHA2 family multidrug resistance protein-like MFS transporter